ncbi:hypothetical protein A2U01_0027886, partial [Trifolium medium]|nr:hypothetical protein [Trifolium medium]
DDYSITPEELKKEFEVFKANFLESVNVIEGQYQEDLQKELIKKAVNLVTGFKNVEVKRLTMVPHQEESTLEHPEPMEVDVSEKFKGKAVVTSDKLPENIYSELTPMTLSMQKELDLQKIEHEALEAKVDLITEDQKEIKQSQVVLGQMMEDVNSSLKTILNLLQSKP